MLAYQERSRLSCFLRGLKSYGTVELAQSKTRASILTTAAAGLQIFGDPELVWLTGEADHDLGDIGAGDAPTAVFLVIPHDEKSKYMVASLYIAQLFRALTQTARVHHGRLPRRVNFLLDEFGVRLEVAA
jgi:type IV secretion system protein VirD4